MTDQPERLSIRRARPEDREPILITLSIAFSPYRPAYPEEAYHHTILDRDLIDARMRHMEVLVAERGRTIIGTVAWSREGHDAHLHGIAVVPTAQGSGCARALLEAVEEAAHADGCRYITLETTQVLKRARAFYNRHGYQLTGMARDFFGIEVEEMAKELV